MNLDIELLLNLTGIVPITTTHTCYWGLNSHETSVLSSKMVGGLVENGEVGPENYP